MTGNGNVQLKAAGPFPWLLAAGILGIVVAAYWSTFHWMFERFEGADSYYGHGYLIPLVSAFLLYRLRHAWLPELGRPDRTRLILGTGLLVAAAFLNFAGHLLTVFFASGIAFILTLVGIGVVLLNLRSPFGAAFPFLYLFFMVPLPNEFLEFLSIPLKTFVSETSVRAIDFLGYPAVLNGFEVTLKWGPVVVGNPCSGLRSLVAMTAMGALVAFIGRLNWRGRVLTFLFTIPTAIFSNFLRISFLLIFAHHKGLDSITPGQPAHDYSGLVLFVVALTLLLLFTRFMEKWRFTRSSA